MKRIVSRSDPDLDPFRFGWRYVPHVGPTTANAGCKYRSASTMPCIPTRAVTFASVTGDRSRW